MGIAQRLTVVKQHDTEPADHLWGRFTPNTRSHGLPDTPQALRWDGVPAAKHPRKTTHHGPEPKSSTPFPIDGQVFFMTKSSGEAKDQFPPHPQRALLHCGCPGVLPAPGEIHDKNIQAARPPVHPRPGRIPAAQRPAPPLRPPPLHSNMIHRPHRRALPLGPNALRPMHAEAPLRPFLYPSPHTRQRP